MKGPTSVQTLIKESLERNADKVLFSQREGYRTRSITGKELDRNIARARGLLKRKGIHRRDKILLHGKNSIEWLTLYFACILSGVTVVPLDFQSDGPLMRRIQKQVKAKIIFQDVGLPSVGIKTVYLNKLNKILSKNTSVHGITSVGPKDALEVVYTSGTTGEPKGVVLTYDNISSALDIVVKTIPLRTRIRLLNLLPLSHVLGHIQGLFVALYNGHELFLTDSVSPKRVISTIRNKRINGVILVPGILSALKQNLEDKSLTSELGLQFRLIGVGGASLSPDLEKWWKRRGIKVIQGYGLTETTAIASLNSLFLPKTGSVGKVPKEVGVKISSEGEILVKGPNVTPGYYMDDEKTSESFAGGWLKTGDLGKFEKNKLYITGRKKDVIVTGSGMNVHAVDLEDVLNKIEGVRECCVLEKDGKIHAVLILSRKVSPLSILRKANNKLLSHQKISDVSVWPEGYFPKTPTGKVKKYQVLEQLSAKQKAYSHDGKLYNIIRSTLKTSKRIKPTSKLVEIGMDSLARLELISALEKEFDVELDEASLDQHVKVSDLENLMGKKIYRVKFNRLQLNPIVDFIRYWSNTIFFTPFATIFSRPEYRGSHNVENIKEPVILVANHQSNFDVPLLLRKIKVKTAPASESKYVFGIGTKGKTRLYRKFVKGLFTRVFYNAYPFGESIGTDLSMEFTGEMLDRGNSIIIFPEGQRTKKGEIIKFKRGVGFLAVNMRAPIVPIKIEGAHKVLPAHKIIPKFGKCRITYGKPLRVEDLSYARATKLIEEKVKEL